MSKFKLKPTHRGCEKIYSQVEDRLVKVECLPFNSVVRLYVKDGPEVDLYPDPDNEGKYSIIVWKKDVRTVASEAVSKDDTHSLKNILDKMK
ncbi:MAG: hypothetical protein KGZ69_15480 [Methylomonas sp.]|nr:hypothetical protein [Methylomonas sp.]